MRQRIVTLAVALTLAAIPAAAQTPDQQAVLATVKAFHDALAQGDSLAALKLLADDVTVLESGGLETRTEYRGHHLPGDIAFARAVPSTRADPVVTVLGDVAWVVGTSRTTGTYRDRPVNSAGAELMVLARTPEGWRIRAVHWSSRSIRSP
ncbi:MAG: nuclear transport factor 2 family protein [Gemmatimonadales bacterium]|nr:nuclear transport factor 2 family protein [Gemmatimonadales bacterium]